LFVLICVYWLGCFLSAELDYVYSADKQINSQLRFQSLSGVVEFLIGSLPGATVWPPSVPRFHRFRFTRQRATESVVFLTVAGLAVVFFRCA